MEGFIAGNISGLAQVIMGHPLDTYKVWLQSGNKVSYKVFHLYRGLKYPLYTSCLSNSIIFGVNYNLGSYIENQWITGFLTGIATTFICCPMEVYKIRRQKNISLPTCRQLGSGFWATLSRETLSCSIYFGSFNYLKKKTDNIFLAGGIAGVLCWLPTYPLDTLKTKIQSGEYNSYYLAFRSNGLLNGLGVCCLRGFLVNSIGFWSYYKALSIINLVYK
jgi:solute carrier family 25 carnitine/acylcarnitine transporter 20/29